MRKAYPALAFVFMLLFSLAGGLLLVESAQANFLPPFISQPIDTPVISINEDGSISPETDLISQSGNVYTLTGDVIDRQIFIGCSNIVFNGNGHSINVTEHATLDEDGKEIVTNYQTVGVWIGKTELAITNVAVKNVEIITSWYAIEMRSCSYCQIKGIKTNHSIRLVESHYNSITHNNAQITISRNSTNNLITTNNITAISVSGPSNVIYRNNMLLEEPPYLSYLSYFSSENTSWDNGSVGNYWSNYTDRYPNASEIGYTGFGDTPYVLDGNNVDNHPLTYPYDIQNDKIALPTREPVIKSEPVVQSGTEPFIVALVAAVSAVSIVGAATFYLYKRRKH